MEPAGRTVSIADWLTAGPHPFVISTAAGGTLSDRSAPALHGELVEQLVTAFTRQYPGSSVQLIGPDPGSRLRRGRPEAFTLADSIEGRSIDERFWIALGAAGATVIGVTRDVESLGEIDGLRTLWLDPLNRDAVAADGPVTGERAETQRFDLPPDWAARRDAVDAAAHGLPHSRGALLEALRSWEGSATTYDARTSQRGLYESRRFGLVDPILEERNEDARRVAKQVSDGLRVLHSDPSRFVSWWAEARTEVDTSLRKLARLTNEELFGLLRRAPDDRAAFGTPVQAESIKAVERDPRGTQTLTRPDTVGADLGMNPARMRLTDLDAEHFTLRPGVPWQFIVTPAHALPRFGSEKASKLLLPEDWESFKQARLASARATVKRELENPGGTESEVQGPQLTHEQQIQVLERLGLGAHIHATSPSPSRLSQILNLPGVRRVLMSDDDMRKEIGQQIDGLGHPTVGGRFDEAQRFVSDHLQVGGEVRYDPEYRVLVFNDMSGRSMSPKVRDTEPDKFMTWVSNVARMVSAQTGLDWEIGLSKQGAKGALKRNPNDMQALAMVAVVKEGLSDRSAVQRLREEIASRKTQVDAALAAAPDHEARSRAVEVWGALGDRLEAASRSRINAAAEAITAYAEAVTAVAAGLAPGSPRVLRDPASVFPLPIAEPRPRSLHVGSRDVGGDHAQATDRPVPPGTIEVRYRDNPDAGDFALLRASLLGRPVDEVRAMVYRPSAGDLSEEDPKRPGHRKPDDVLFDGRRWADQARIPVEVLAADLVAGTGRPAVPPGAVEHTAGGQRYFRFEPSSHLAEQHLDYQVPVQAPRIPAHLGSAVAAAARMTIGEAPASTASGSPLPALIGAARVRTSPPRPRSPR
ncbi:hypothetical protein [Pseudosporangium ferrugineum]|uniref:Uncharacterized protein n=1 Tax=Pseudosporangium ferrugineum TaxID=439699 RepID=A0A2T0RF26_9ACTN|nr:hypothetical protein [Pseudosporangium ferrugineum]PRY19742.1 hypothetical protein CLV70_12938 [Pseudosporangium ferrugineum]